ncbi:hypothetical protein [Novosphingobium capsulatum]|uniref:hypothetical protein n=1 Tax=Novosphingobium capsulatum TaxID=13688 RepID=UPI002E0FBB62|nr:hypothetical protein U0041_04035 [Novosphingobium capsulatum]
MPVHALQSSFNGGAVSPRLFGRTDTAIYDGAVAELLNFAPTVEGPAIKRSGTIAAGAADATATTIIPFEFNAEQAYALVFSDDGAGAGLVHFYSNSGAPLVDGGGSPVVVNVPYTAADAQALYWQQSADVLYLTHPSYPPAKISRVGAAAFTYAVLALSGGPFDDQNSDSSLTVYASAAAGVVTLTATSAIFRPGHVGALFQLQAKDFAAIPLWEPGMSVPSAGVLWRWEGKVYQNVGGGKTGSTPPTHTFGTYYDGTNTNDLNDKNLGTQWTYYCDQYGQLKITAVASDGLSATATVLRTIPPGAVGSYGPFGGLLGGSWRWNFGRFSADRGWPKAVCIWNDRLVLFTDFEVIGSVVGDYLNFSSFDDTGRLEADLAFRFRITGSNPINWIAPDLQLLLSTDKAEWTVGPVNSQAAPSSTNLMVTRQSHFGSEPVRPVQSGLKTIFVQRGGKKIREAGYDYIQNRYSAANLLIWCRHYGQPGIKRLGWQQESEEILWALRNDGVLLMHAYAPEQQVKGWGECRIAGFDGTTATVLDFCVIPASTGSPDSVWMLVDRAGVRSVEVLDPWWIDGTDISDARFLDGAIWYDGAPATHIGIGGTGFPTSWAGKIVQVLADGQYLNPVTVASDGSITLPAPAAKVCAGLFYPARITGLPPKLPQPHSGGAAEMVKKKLVNLLVRTVETAGLWAGQKLASRLEELFRRNATTRMDNPDPLFSGVSDKVMVTGATDREGAWVLESRAPLPAIVTMVRGSYQPEDKD